jgi:hypothetical protein
MTPIPPLNSDLFPDAKSQQQNLQKKSKNKYECVVQDYRTSHKYSEGKLTVCGLQENIKWYEI